eukprot:gene7483-7566_t
MAGPPGGAAGAAGAAAAAAGLPHPPEDGWGSGGKRARSA